MPFFQLSTDDLNFPPAHFADSEGLIAVGGDLSPERVLNAYKNGIYFWFGPMDPIKWWSPDPRLILIPGQAILDNVDPETPISILPTTEMTRIIKDLQIQENQGDMAANWLTEEMAVTYLKLIKDGYAKAFDIYSGDRYTGSIIGIHYHTVFFVEYIFIPGKQKDTSAYDLCLFALSEFLNFAGFQLIDIQKETIRISDIGITELSRLEYLDKLRKGGTTSLFFNQWTKPYTVNGKL
jgi:leucyl/phenylalanyl-tRNA--protein transferase